MNLKELAKNLNVPEDSLAKRMDGRIEWFCEYEVGHTIWFPENSDSIHSCCSHGCCSRF